MSPEGRSLLAARIRAGAVPFLEEPDLERNVARRMAIYKESAGGAPDQGLRQHRRQLGQLGNGRGSLEDRAGARPRASSSLRPPAAASSKPWPRTKVPVIHLLNVKGLCERYGLPWDPRPLSAPGEGQLYRRASSGRSTATIALTAAYVLAIIIVLAFSDENAGRTGEDSTRRKA